ncbi:MAG: hypothetical protein QOH05_2108 [Acetobacteraceae bacterium]|jgi:broad specificity phosphatase PhoE|nr:hypothetical protein [Acetobacteraceae bacterium]
MTCVYFITHPDVLIDPAVPITEWTLSPLGQARMDRLLLQPWVPRLRVVWCSTERKAIDGAARIGDAIGTTPRQLPALGENDRSATGYLPKAEFEATADAFFANPHDSVRGWETAAGAQRRIVAATARILAETPRDHDIALVSHGAVGALLLCHLKGCEISRAEDQPGAGGGNYFCFYAEGYALRYGWRPIEPPTA